VVRESSLMMLRSTRWTLSMSVAVSHWSSALSPLVPSLQAVTVLVMTDAAVGTALTTVTVTVRVVLAPAARSMPIQVTTPDACTPLFEADTNVTLGSSKSVMLMPVASCEPVLVTVMV